MSEKIGKRKKKKTLILLLIIFFLLFGWITYLYFSSENTNDFISSLRKPFVFFFDDPSTSIENPDSTIPREDDLLSGGGNEEGGVTDPYGEYPDEYAPPAPLRSFIELTPEPIAGATWINQSPLFPVLDSSEDSTGTTGFVRYIEKATGHIYDVRLGTLERKRLTNTTIPRLHTAEFNADGSYILIQYLDSDLVTTKTFLASISPTHADNNNSQEQPGVLSGNFLPDNIEQAVLSPDGTTLFYLIEDYRESTAYVTPVNVVQPRIIHSFQFTEITAQWIDNDTLLITTKPSGGVHGYAYTLETSTGAFTKLIEGEALTLLPQEDRYLVANTALRGSPDLQTFVAPNDYKTLSISTLPEKCVWSIKFSTVVYCGVPDRFENVRFPDSWYQGNISFVDTIVRINTSSNTTNTVLGYQTEEIPPFDATRLFIDGHEEQLFLLTKKTTDSTK